MTDPPTSNVLSRPAVIVTGGSRGIGRGIGERLANDGWRVAVNYVRNAAAAEEVVQSIESGGGRAVAIQADVSQSKDRRRLVAETMTSFGRLDALVNNAGITSPGRLDLLDATEENWDLVLGANLKGPFFLSQEAAKAIIACRRQGKVARGWIVNVSSISALAASTNRADYCIAKSGVRMMTQLFAARLAEEGIQTFELRPGVIASDMTAPVREKYDAAIADGLSPMRRWGEASDVAEAVAAILGGAFPFSTGDCLHIDGGLHIQRL